MISTTKNKPSTKTASRMAREPQEKGEVTLDPAQQPGQAVEASRPNAAKPATKSAIVIGMLTRSEGATLEAMVAATVWLAHTARAALAGLKKKGFTISSEKVDGVRTYHAIAPDKPANGAVGEETGS